MRVKLDQKDLEILRVLQTNCKLPAKEIAERTRTKQTTVYAKIKRMEKTGIIRSYKAILDAKKLGRGVVSFVLASFAYSTPFSMELLSQKEVAKEVSLFPEVQEVHIISGDWDLLIKVKARDVDAVGKFVVDKLRTVRGIEKTLTCVAFETLKETTDVEITAPV